MNRLQHTILAGIVRTIDAWKVATIRHHDGTLHDARRFRHESWRWDLARHDAAEIDLEEFLGFHPSPSERTMATRAYKALEAAGYIQRLHSEWSNRTTQIRLLPAGRAAVNPAGVVPLPVSFSKPGYPGLIHVHGEGATDG